jgi:hypothetical protein
MAAIAGKCHCGNIGFTLRYPEAEPKIAARACGCGFCVKHGGVWTSRPDLELDVKVNDPAAVSRYRFGTATADFLICTRCGVPPLVTCDIDGRTHAVVNVSTFEGLDPATISRAPASFEGEGVGDRLARRKRSWIGTVRFS